MSKKLLETVIFNEENNETKEEQKEIKEDFSDLFSIEKEEEIKEEKKEVEEIKDNSFEEFLKKEDNNPQNDQLKKTIATSDNLPSFEQIMRWKFEHNDIFLIDVGTPLESILYGASMDKYIITTFKASQYYNFIEKFGSIAKNKKEYFKTIITECLLFPTNLDMDKMHAGVAELIIGTILKNSKLESNFDIKRL